MSRPGMTLCVIVCAALYAAPATAQTIDFLSRSDFHLTAEHLSSDDPRFVWDTNFGGDLDLVDFGAGRVTFAANYQAILGEEIRKFDPNQGNYFLTGSVSKRFPSLELAGVFHHESRHLGDRAKIQAVDWNMIGVRALTSASFSGGRVDVRADLRWPIMKSFVDYTSEFDGTARTVFPLHSRISAIADGGLRLIGTDGSTNRGVQAGYRLEGGLRLDGKDAAVELFVASERRIDPYPLELTTAHWFGAGFRLLSR